VTGSLPARSAYSTGHGRRQYQLQGLSKKRILPPTDRPGGNPIATPPEQFLCVTAPCGPYTPNNVTQLLTQPSSLSIPRAQPGDVTSRYLPNLHGIPTLGEIMATDGPPTGSSVRFLQYAAPIVAAGISERENREIDAAIEEQSLRAERIEQLGEFKETIHPDRLLDIAGNIAEGIYATVPPPPRIAAPEEVLAPVVQTQPVGRPEWVGSVGEAPWTPEPDTLPPEPGDQSMDLSSILGAFSTAADIYGTIQTARAPPPQAFVAPGPAPATPYDNSWQDWVDGPLNFLEPSTSIPSAGGTVPQAYSGGCISQRDRRIAAASGVSPEAVDRVLHYARQGRRRRRRMLTKSDVGDISTMKAILGNGEAFKLWLAKATR